MKPTAKASSSIEDVYFAPKDAPFFKDVPDPKLRGQGDPYTAGKPPLTDVVERLSKESYTSTDEKGRYIFPGINGIPYRQSSPDPPNIKNIQIDTALVQVLDARVRVLCLWVPEDLKAYQSIWENIGRGRCVLSAEEKQYVPDKENWVVFIRYAELFLEFGRPQT